MSLHDKQIKIHIAKELNSTYVKEAINRISMDLSMVLTYLLNKKYAHLYTVAIYDAIIEKIVKKSFEWE